MATPPDPRRTPGVDELAALIARSQPRPTGRQVIDEDDLDPPELREDGQ